MNKKTYYVTYGFISGAGRCYSEIQATTRGEAYMLAMQKTHGGFARVYETKEEAGVDEFGLEKIPLKKRTVYWRPPKEAEKYREEAKKMKNEKRSSYLPGPRQRVRTGIKLF